MEKTLGGFMFALFFEIALVALAPVGVMIAAMYSNSI